MKLRTNILRNGRLQTALIAGVLLGTVSCTKNFETINTDKNKIPSAGAAEIPFLFSRAEEVVGGPTGNLSVECLGGRLSPPPIP